MHARSGEPFLLHASATIVARSWPSCLVWTQIQQGSQNRTGHAMMYSNGDLIQPKLLKQLSDPQSPRTTGYRVWECGLMLAKYCEKAMPDIPHRRVLELGCGTGVAGIALPFTQRCYI